MDIVGALLESGMSPMDAVAAITGRPVERRAGFACTAALIYRRGAWALVVREGLPGATEARLAISAVRAWVELPAHLGEEVPMHQQEPPDRSRQPLRSYVRVCVPRRFLRRSIRAS